MYYFLGSSSHPSQLDHTHVQDAQGIGGGQSEGYGAAHMAGGDHAERRPPPPASEQPYGRPSQYDQSHTLGRNNARPGQNDPYAGASMRPSEYGYNKAAGDPHSQYDFTEHAQRPNTAAGQLTPHGTPSSGPPEYSSLQRGRTNDRSQYDQAFLHNQNTARDGTYPGAYQSGSAPASQFMSQRQPKGLHAYSYLHFYTNLLV